MKQRYKWAAMTLLAAALLVLLLPGRRVEPEGLTLISFDVGQGDAILLTADGFNVLVDAGGRPTDAVGAAEYVVIPYLKTQGMARLDMVFNTHPDIDHIGGLFAILDEISVKSLTVFPGYPGNERQAQLLQLAAAKKVEILSVAAGDVFHFSENFSVRVLSPPAGAEFGADMVNNGSLVLQVSYQDFDVLLTGDLVGEQLQSAVADLACSDIEVLQLPHHGSRYSYAEDWYANFAPQAVLISVGRDNSFGQPGAEVVEYWQRLGVPVWRTDLHGSCRISYLNGQVSYDSVISAELPDD